MIDARLRIVLALLCLATACAPATSQGRRQIEQGDLAGAQQTLESARDARPRSADARVALGELYYQRAREALDRDRDEAAYLAYLERATNEFVAALELEPENEQPHFYLALIDVYRGEIRDALRGFNNARRLQPTGIAYTNIAEVFVYLDKTRQAHEWNDLGRQRGAPHSAWVFNQMLIFWKQGNLPRARRSFETLRRDFPEAISTINVAKLPETPQTFEAFAGYCCDSPACGPYMADACKTLELAVREREISEEAVLRELRIEMERKRRLKEVYDQRKDLEVTIEDEETRTPR